MSHLLQEITKTTDGLEFTDWVATLTGDAKTAADAILADRDTKFDAQVAAGNVFINTEGQTVWLSAELEAAYIDNVGLAYADLWEQWKTETGGTLDVVSIEEPSADKLKMVLDTWATANLSAEDLATFTTQKAGAMDYLQNTLGGKEPEGLTEEEKTTMQGMFPELKTFTDSYKAYLAA